MNHSNSPSNSTSGRATLKLKIGVRKPPREPKTPPPILPQPRNTSKLKPGAHWSDEYRERMQADMDALTSR